MALVVLDMVVFVFVIAVVFSFVLFVFDVVSDLTVFALFSVVGLGLCVCVDVVDVDPEVEEEVDARDAEAVGTDGGNLGDVDA